MTEMKCPFCQQELRQGDSWTWGCVNDDCESAGLLCGTKELWEAFIVECAEHEMCHTQMLKTTEKLERTRKALDVAVDALKEIKDGKTPVSLGIYMDINDALEQITALEQKDVK